jgi:hypothetical protein
MFVVLGARDDTPRTSLKSASMDYLGYMSTHGRIHPVFIMLRGVGGHLRLHNISTL